MLPRSTQLLRPSLVLLMHHLEMTLRLVDRLLDTSSCYTACPYPRSSTLCICCRYVTFYCNRCSDSGRATRQEPQFLQHDCLLSLSEATHTHTQNEQRLQNLPSHRQQRQRQRQRSQSLTIVHRAVHCALNATGHQAPSPNTYPCLPRPLTMIGRSFEVLLASTDATTSDLSVLLSH
jgi:hypothetical protein